MPKVKSSYVLDPKTIEENLRKFPTLKELFCKYGHKGYLEKKEINRFNCPELLTWLHDLGPGSSYGCAHVEKMLQVLCKHRAPGYERFLKSFLSANKEYDFMSKYSELEVMFSVFQNSDLLNLQRIEPKTYPPNDYRGDLLVSDKIGNKIFIEVTTCYPMDFSRKFDKWKDYLWKRLERIKTGLMITMDIHIDRQQASWHAETFCTISRADQIVKEFRNTINNLADNEVCYPFCLLGFNLKKAGLIIEIVGISTSTDRTHLSMHYGSCSSVMDRADLIENLAKNIMEEKKHFESNTNNVILVYFGSYPDFTGLDEEDLDFRRLRSAIFKHKSSRVHGVFSFKDCDNLGNLINPNVLYLKEEKKLNLSSLLDLWNRGKKINKLSADDPLAKEIVSHLLKNNDNT